MMMPPVSVLKGNFVIYCDGEGTNSSCAWTSRVIPAKITVSNFFKGMQKALVVLS
jgi:hypothetical protein